MRINIKTVSRTGFWRIVAMEMSQKFVDGYWFTRAKRRFRVCYLSQLITSCFIFAERLCFLGVCLFYGTPEIIVFVLSPRITNFESK